MLNVQACCFLALYLIAMLRPVQPLIEYWVRFDYYKNELCLNRARPEMKCNGQCILMQRLKQIAHEQNTPEQPSAQRINLEDYPVSTVDQTDLLRLSSTTCQLHIGFYDCLKPSSFSGDIFRPPA